jgi:hypothetical protein
MGTSILWPAFPNVGVAVAREMGRGCRRGEPRNAPAAQSPQAFLRIVVERDGDGEGPALWLRDLSVRLNDGTAVVGDTDVAFSGASAYSLPENQDRARVLWFAP